MTQPQNSVSDASGRFYTWQGRKYVSVTTVLRVLAKPALVGWAAKVTAEAAADMAGVLPSLLEADREGTLRMLKKRHREQASAAADLGTALHVCAEALVAKKPLESFPEATVPYVEGFLKFWSEVHPEPLFLEATVYSSLGYAGTADLFARLDGQIAVLDYKTGRSVWPETALQLAAYARGDFIGRGETEHIPPLINAGYAVHIRPGDYALVPVRIDGAVWAGFQAALNLWKWQQEAHLMLGEA